MTTIVGGPSRHLSWSELACHDTLASPYPHDWRGGRAKALGEAFEAVRAVWGQPITILSAFRTPEYNAACGGAARSEHLQGRALDLRPPEGVLVVDFWEAILEVTARTSIRGVGYACPSKGGYCHIDIRPADRVATWRY